MALVVLIAVTIPYFSDFMNLIGAVANTLLIYIFPVVFHAKLFGVSRGLLSALILVVGCIGGGMGTLDALSNLYHDVMRR